MDLPSLEACTILLVCGKNADSCSPKEIEFAEFAAYQFKEDLGLAADVLRYWLKYEGNECD